MDEYVLPCSAEQDRRRVWRLDARGLEWTGFDGNDHWMPYACIRRATLGQVPGKGWRLRLSGPPGAVCLEAGDEAAPDDLQIFSRLAKTVLEEADAAGCGVRFRLNHGRMAPDWLWARSGRRLENSLALIAALAGEPR